MIVNRPAYNTGLAKVAVQYSADTFVVSQSLVLRINICGKNRHLRQARNRWQKLKKTITINVNKKHFKVLSSRTQEIN